MKVSQITIHFPGIMNIYHHRTLEIKGPLSLEKVKRLVFEKFQQELCKMWGPQVQATSEDLILKGRGEIICCEDKLRSIQTTMFDFEAYFVDNSFKSTDLTQDPYSIALKKFCSEFA